MEIVKAFTTNTMHTEIVIKGTINDPLFRASDIAEILELNNFRSSITGFDDSEKVVRKSSTLGGLQEVTFLTEKGLYKLLFRSRKPIATQFQNWACDVIKEIRLNNFYNLDFQVSFFRCIRFQSAIINDVSLLVCACMGLGCHFINQFLRII